jgi:hypothetical protein
MADTAAPPAHVRGVRRCWRRVLLWGLPIALLAVAQALLVFLVLQYEAARAQDRAEAAALAVADEARLTLSRGLQALQLMAFGNVDASAGRWRSDASQLLRAQRDLVRLERRDAAFDVIDAVQAPHRASLFEATPRREQGRAGCPRRGATPWHARVLAQLLRATGRRQRAGTGRPVPAARRGRGRDPHRLVLAERGARDRCRRRCLARP